MNRRTFLSRAMGAGGALIGGLVVAPTMASWLSPIWRQKRGAEWNSVGPLSRFSVGEVTQGFVDVRQVDWGRTLRTKLVYVWHRRERDLVVYSRSCTDLSCPVNWDAGSACFYCPCHGGIFSQEGEVMAGPPKRPMYRYEHRIVGDTVEVNVHSVPAMA